MAKKKATGSVKNGRDSISKRLGVKIGNLQNVRPGNIIVRQKGTNLICGLNTKMGRDRTIFSIKNGKVFFSKGIVNVI
ncbi:50S ribosomal protein L27 [Candidatus Vidania fulgoroideorum]